MCLLPRSLAFSKWSGLGGGGGDFSFLRSFGALLLWPFFCPVRPSAETRQFRQRGRPPSTLHSSRRTKRAKKKRTEGGGKAKKGISTFNFPHNKPSAVTMKILSSSLLCDCLCVICGASAGASICSPLPFLAFLARRSQKEGEGKKECRLETGGGGGGGGLGVGPRQGGG